MHFQKNEENASILQRIGSMIQTHRVKIYCIVYFWKIVLTLAMVTMIFGIGCESGADCLKTLYGEIQSAKLTSKLFSIPIALSSTYIGQCSGDIAYLIAVVNIAASLFCYVYVKTEILLTSHT